MYDLTVAGAHTFAVGDGEWVVHNQDPCWFAPRPTKIDDSNLQEIITGQSGDYRFGSSIRNSGTADAVMNEMAT